MPPGGARYAPPPWFLLGEFLLPCFPPDLQMAASAAQSSHRQPSHLLPCDARGEALAAEPWMDAAMGSSVGDKGGVLVLDLKRAVTAAQRRMASSALPCSPGRKSWRRGRRAAAFSGQALLQHGGGGVLAADALALAANFEHGFLHAVRDVVRQPVRHIACRGGRGGRGGGGVMLEECVRCSDERTFEVDL